MFERQKSEEEKLNNLISNTSEQILREQAKSSLKVRGHLEQKALRYLELKQREKDIKEELEELKKVFRKGGCFETDNVKVKVSYGSEAARVKPLKDFIKAGFSEKLLSEKNLLTYYNTGDRVGVTDRRKKEQ